MKSSKKAFTLIELLVVIAIIGILATVAVIAVGNARTKARDAKRVGNAKQIQTALELYFNDNGRYPTAAEFNSGTIQSDTPTGLVTYMLTIPSAPFPADGSCDNSSNQYSYNVASDGSTYTISYCIGGKTGALNSGVKCLTRDGVMDAGCSTSGEDLPAACSNTTVGGDQCTYGGQTYDTVTIGSQVWMKENLNYGLMINRLGATSCVNISSSFCQTDNNTVEKYCYNDNSSYCDTDGGIYEWPEAMNLPYDCGHASAVDNGDDTYTLSCPTSGSHTVQAKHQGICPSGWHIPNEIDWHTLEFGLADNPDTDCDSDHSTGDCLPSGYRIKAASGWSDSSNDLSGFSARPSGVVDGGDFLEYGHSTNFVGSVPNSSDIAIDRFVYSGHGGIMRALNGRGAGLSVRCIKD